MKIPKELKTVTPVSKLLAVVTFICILIITFSMGRRYQYVIDLKQYTFQQTAAPPPIYKPAPKPLNTMPDEPVATPTSAPISLVVPQSVSTNWAMYDKDFGGRIHLKFKYPQSDNIYDVDPDSGSVEIRHPQAPSAIMILDTAQYTFSFQEAYTGGSWRVWFTNMLKKYHGTYNDAGVQKTIDYSGLQFKDIILPNGKQYLQVFNFPSQSNFSYMKDNIYLGVQNGIMFSVENHITDQAIKNYILSSIEASVPVNK